MAELVESTGLSQKKIGSILGVNERTVRRWVTGASTAPYVVQFCLEVLVLSPEG
jgi:DNA-binding transcriptional regulator YiaG